MAYVEGGSISVSNKSKCAAEHLFPLRLHVLKEVVLTAHNG